MPEIISGFASTIMAAIAIFLYKEHFGLPPRVSGVFHTKSKVTQSTASNQSGLLVFHTLVLCSDGKEIIGTSEKTGEINLSGEKIRYIGDKRIRGVVTGRVERKYLGRSEIHLHVEEDGSTRKSTIFFSFKLPLIAAIIPFRQAQIPTGSFNTTAADSKGTTERSDLPFPEHPTHYVPPRTSP